MIRSLIAGLLILVAASTAALAQSCTGSPVAVQILGSGAPGFVKDRANTSYLLWIGSQALGNAREDGVRDVHGGTAHTRFERSAGKAKRFGRTEDGWHFSGFRSGLEDLPKA